MRRTDTLLIDTDCSKGTYIRSLCADIGEALGIPATMAFLVRRRVGDFQLGNALTLEELQAQGASALLDPSEFLSHLESYALNPLREKAFRNGLGTGNGRISLKATYCAFMLMAFSSALADTTGRIRKSFP